MSDVFISYSRRERLFADRLATELEKDGRTVWIDRVGIQPTAEWWEEIKRGIEASDNFVLIMSPASLGSPVCHLEIEYARQLTKRIIPLYHIIHDYEGTKSEFGDRLYKHDSDGFLLKLYGDRNPMVLFEENWSILPAINRVEAFVKLLDEDSENTLASIDEADFMSFFPAFRKALDTDIAHVHQHTRLLTRTREWLVGDRNNSFLLNSVETTEAEEWLNKWSIDKEERKRRNLPPKSPQPNEDIRAFINQSRLIVDRQHRLQRNLRLATITFALVGLVSVIAAIGSFIILQDTQEQANVANTQVAGVEPTLISADATLSSITNQIEESENRRESLRLASSAAEIMNSETGNAETAALLAIRALSVAYTEQADAILTQILEELFTEQIIFDGDDPLGWDATSVHFLSNETLLINYFDGRIRVWDWINQTELAIYSSENLQVRSDSRISPNGQKAVQWSAADNINILNLDSFEILRSFEPNIGEINDVEWISNDSEIILGGSDGVAQLWNIDTGELLRTFSGHESGIESTALSLDNQTLVTGSWDGTARIWDLDSEDQPRVIEVGNSIGLVVTDVDINDENTMLLTGTSDNIARLWDINTGTLLQTFEGHSGIVYVVRFLPDNASVITGSSDGTARIWDISTGQVLRTLSGHTDIIDSIDISGDETVLATSSKDGTVRIWNFDLVPDESIYSTNLDWVRRIAFAPDGESLVTGSGDVLGSSVQIWEISSGILLESFEGHSEFVNDVAFSPDGNLLATSAGGIFNGQRPVHLWDLQTRNRQILNVDLSYESARLAFSPDGNILAVILGDFDMPNTSLQLWRISDGGLIDTITYQGSLMSLAFSADGTLIVVGTNQGLRVTEIETNSMIFTSDFGGQVAWDSNSNRLIISEGEQAQILDLDDSTTEITLDGHFDYITDVIFSPNGQLVATSSYDASIRLWNALNGQILRVLTGHVDQVNSISFAPNGEMIASGSSDGTVRVWHTDYRDFIAYACDQVFRDLTSQERQEHSVFYDETELSLTSDNISTCPQFSENSN